MHNKAFAITDVHGRADLLRKALDHINQEIQDTGESAYVIFLGDYVDRGPDSREVIDIIMRGNLDSPDNQTWVALKGNHEDMMVEACETQSDLDIGHWLGNGGVATLNSYARVPNETRLEVIPDLHIQWMKELPLYFETDHHIFVHAGLMPGVPLKEQEPMACLWIRERFLRDPGDFWGKHIVHGHTPQHALKPYLEKPEVTAWRTNLDTCAYHTGVLSVGVFDLTRLGGPVDIIQIKD